MIKQKDLLFFRSGEYKIIKRKGKDRITQNILQNFLPNNICLFAHLVFLLFFSILQYYRFIEVSTFFGGAGSMNPRKYQAAYARLFIDIVKSNSNNMANVYLYQSAYEYHFYFLHHMAFILSFVISILHCVYLQLYIRCKSPSINRYNVSN